MDPAPSDARLSRYRIDRLLGAGGMGSVYLARDLSLDRPVAIKFISEDKAADPGARRRLLREARAAAALDHPNICSVYEVLDDDRPCIVMQYVEGETLANVLRRGRLDVRFALNVTADIAAALSAAHKRNVIHRDLKPQNIIITADQRAKLLDFGIARYVNTSEPSDDVTTQSRLTETGDTPGTPPYMSPEQVHGRVLDGRSDLFALGAVLFECLTGRRAFQGRNGLEVAAQILSHDPPPVSSLRPELGEQYDELCRKLLARDPRDRFQSADAVLGALQLLSTGTGTPRENETDASVSPRARRRWMFVAAASAVLVLLAGVAAWRLSTPPTAPRDPQAADWYRRGTNAIRDGSPHSARLALSESVRIEPDYIPAHIRLAEADTELDDAESAQGALLRADALAESSWRLSREDRTRARAVRAVMLRDADQAVAAYREIAERRPDAADAWLDLGRAQDAFSLASDARQSFERALELDQQYAAAHLRRATILGDEGKRDEALAAFAEAERIYHASANVEGEVESLIRRGIFLNARGDLGPARFALERALNLASPLQSHAQRIRAELTLSSVMASAGEWANAERMAAAAVDAALREHLETVAAEGLVDLANVMFQRGKRAEPDAHLTRAIELAEERHAYRIVARAKLQQASNLATGGHEEAAIAAMRWPLEYFQTKRYRRYELLALAILARAHEGLGHYDEAGAVAEQALAAATQIKDDAQIGEALENLAGRSTAIGALPEALEHRLRGLDIHRRQQETSKLGYDLTNTADLLIRLGRHDEAAKLLDEIDAGVANALEVYEARARRAAALRLTSAAVRQQSPEVARVARQLLPSDSKPDSTSQLAVALFRYSSAANPGSRRSIWPSDPLAGSMTSPIGREVRYWDLFTRLGQNDPRALTGAEETLAAKDATVSYEFEWRIAAIGAAAAQRLKLADREQTLRTRAAAALKRLRLEWKSGIEGYDARPDLTELRRKAGLNRQS